MCGWPEISHTWYFSQNAECVVLSFMCNPVTKANEEKPAAAKKANAEDTDAGKQKVKIAEPTPKADKEEESSEKDDSMSEGEGEESDGCNSADDKSDDSEEVETPEKVLPTITRF
ncbi:OLC1v1019372C1 [Oldenlandia corymbosa var. corymbosa]|uniref:OLC1v1019372C1 n=1 Tax=Oldenlandia corymbosa var. corymbosa TaxID=529605 RepID=A0AAV1EDY1_OLDCO|nr:OLC1v1019372C1 [Oldenlandia corymbosa var. corymbosa]